MSTNIETNLTVTRLASCAPQRVTIQQAGRGLEEIVMKDCNRKLELYKTAKAAVSCAHFKAGEFVSLEFAHWEYCGTTAWYHISRSEKGPLPCVVAYPSHHLMEFCL